MIIKQMPKADFREFSDMRSIVNNYVKTIGCTFGRYSVQERQISLITLIEANSSCLIINVDAVQIQSNDFAVLKKVSPQ